MSLDTKTVKKIAFLARIKVEDARLEHLAGEMSSILEWIEQLAEVDTDGVQPMTSVTESTLPRREDKISDGDNPERVLSGAPDREGDFYTVPKVVG